MKFRFSFFAGLLSAALFGISTPISKIILTDLNPFLLAGLLYLGAGVGLLFIQILLRRKIQIKSINDKNYKKILGMIFFGGILGPVFLLFGLKMASSGSVSLWLNLELVATCILGYLFFKEHLGSFGWIGVTAALSAGILLSVNEKSAGFIPGLFLLIACFCWGLDNHFTALIDGITPIQSTIIKGIIAGIVNSVIGISLSDSQIISVSIPYSLLIGLFSYGISIALYITSAQNLGAIRSQILFSSAPFWGLIFSFLIIGESISMLQFLSAALFIISVSLLIFEKHAHRHFHNAVEHIHYHSHKDGHHHHSHDHNDADMHIHLHKHDEEEHSHPHLPDIHHRHEH